VKTEEELKAEEAAKKAEEAARAAETKSRRGRSAAADALMPEGVFDMPRWLIEAAPYLIQAAEHLIQGPKKGQQKKAWVKASLKALARNHDLQNVPDWIEHPLEDAAIDILVQVAFLNIPGLANKPEQAKAA
jgi:hypothetical protein